MKNVLNCFFNASFFAIFEFELERSNLSVSIGGNIIDATTRDAVILKSATTFDKNLVEIELDAVLAHLLFGRLVLKSETTMVLLASLISMRSILPVRSASPSMMFSLAKLYSDLAGVLRKASPRSVKKPRSSLSPRL